MASEKPSKRASDGDPLREFGIERHFYLIVADHDRGAFSVEGPMTDDHPWGSATRYARDHERRIAFGLAGLDRDALKLLLEHRQAPW